MKRRAALSTTQAIPAPKRRKTQLAMTQEIVKAELRKKIDWKYTDYAVTSSPVYYNSPPLSLLSNLTRGQLGINNFLGNTIRPQAITIKYFCETSQETYQALRFVVFQWFDAATPATSGVLQDSNQTIALVSPTLVTNKPYIKILYDKLHVLATTSSPAGNGIIQGQTVYIKGRRLKEIRYNSSTNTCQDGNLFVLAISNDTALGTVNLTMYSRVTFADD